MSVTRTEILALVDFLTGTLADQTVCTRLYDEVLRELAFDPRAWCTAIDKSTTGILTDTSDPSRLELRSISLSMGRMLALFYSGRQLTEEDRQELQAFNRNWQDEVGDPIAYTRDQENTNILRLYPKPRVLPVSGGSLSNSVDSPIVIYTDIQTSIPDILALPVALFICSREFERESNHRDVPTSQVWHALAADYLTKVF